MNTILAAVMLSASSFVTPTPENDIVAFIRLMWANERCPGITINYNATLEQVGDLGHVLQWDDERTRDKILVETRIAKFEYQQSDDDFCGSAKKTYQSYDPAYLRKVGVTN